jgi:hypothetical protein
VQRAEGGEEEVSDSEDHWPLDRTHDVTVKVIGQVGSGKTTVANIIRRTLAGIGISTLVKDPDGPIPDGTLDLLVGRLAQRSARQPYPVVKIETVQTRRRPLLGPRIEVADWVDEDTGKTCHAVHLRLTDEGCLFTSTAEARAAAERLLAACDEVDALENER